MRIKLFRLIIVFVGSILFTNCVSFQVNIPKSIDEKTNDVLQVSEDFIWGVNGHPVTSKDYLNASIDQQLSLLQQFQMNYYRFDIRLDSQGNVILYEKEFDELLLKAEKHNIDLMPVVLINLFLDDYRISEAEAFRRGETQMKGFVSKYGKNIKVYNLGNEQDLRLILDHRTGENTSDYDLEKFKIVASYFKGMISGIKQINPNAKTLINSSNNLHFGYLRLLENYQVNYDILGFHWYSFTRGSEKILKNSLNLLSQEFNHPIWITEINRRDGSYMDFENNQPNLINSYISVIKTNPKVKAFFIYELFDEPSLYGLNKLFEQSEYGLYKMEIRSHNLQKFISKPVSNQIKYNIEESKNGLFNYLQSLYQYLMLPQPSDDELNYWKTQFNKSDTTEVFLESFLIENQIYFKPQDFQEVSKENRNDEIVQFISQTYEHYLNRLPTDKEVKLWRRKLPNKKNRISINKVILLSQEFWENAMKTGYERNTGFKFIQH